MQTPTIPSRMHKQDQSVLSDQLFDVLVIGGGVVGCAMARRFALEGASVALLEKAADILDGASKGNSAILHTGFDAPVGSLEQECVAAGYKEYLEIHEKFKLPLLRTGAIVAAWDDEQLDKLPTLIEQAHANGVDDVHPLTASEIIGREPQLSPAVKGGFHVPGEFVIDPWSAPHAYLLQAIAAGASVFRQAGVLAGSFDGVKWQLETSRGMINARTVINCAGLYGDIVNQQLLGEGLFNIRPRKGQFLVYDKAASAVLGSILLPVPSEKTKGIVVCRTAFGNLLVGPTAEDQESRTDASVTSDTLRMLHEKATAMLPALAHMPVTATYAGLRPATEEKEYRISSRPDQRYISVGGIRSTGLTAALGIAQHIFKLFQQFDGGAYTPPDAVIWPEMPLLASPVMASPVMANPDIANPVMANAVMATTAEVKNEQDIPDLPHRDWAREGNGGIVCHCELVTRREVENALSGPLAANSLAGLKRRTRVTMGRCQGFYCTAHLAEITRGRLAQPMHGSVAEQRTKEGPSPKDEGNEA